MLNPKHGFTCLRLLVLLGISSSSGRSEDPSGALEALWQRAVLYQDDSHPILHLFKLRGRYHGQFHQIDSEQGNPSGWEDRRFRYGFEAKFFGKLEIRMDGQSNDGFRDLYDGLTDAYLRWKPSPSLTLTAGKVQPLIGQYDWLESSNFQPTFERSQLFNQLKVNHATGVTAEGRLSPFSWRAGLYSNDTPPNTGGSGSFGDGEFGDFNGGFSLTAGAGYHFEQGLGTEVADLRLDWLHSEREAGDRVLGRYDDILAVSFSAKQGPASIRCESFHGLGGDGADSDVSGFLIQPLYELIPGRLQLVGRYSHARSKGPLGVIAQSRYEATVAAFGGRGNRYHSVYGGVQYFIQNSRFKLMAGAEWARLSGPTGESYEGITGLTGIRVSF
jgi:phosphate-selective porin OprO and OprP